MILIVLKHRSYALKLLLYKVMLKKPWQELVVLSF